MIHKPRTISSELLTLRHLNLRMHLPPSDKQHLLNLNKGFEGELKFDTWTEKLSCDCLILNDLLLKMNNTHFQIDSTIITANIVYIYEVKNLKGDYIYDTQKDKVFQMLRKREIVNPLSQLARGESLFSQLMLKLGFNLPIDGSVVFVNNEFSLYQAPPDKPMIYLPQLNRYFRQFNSETAQLNKKHFLMADKLASLHIRNSRYKQIPSYNYDTLRKGITCFKCKSFSLFIKGSNCICEKCTYKESISMVVLRSVNEFQLLFPQKKITTNIIHDWCQVVKSKKTVHSILSSNFKAKGEKRWMYFE